MMRGADESPAARTHSGSGMKTTAPRGLSAGRFASGCKNRPRVLRARVFTGRKRKHMSQNTLVLEEVIENPTRTLFDQRYSPIRILFHGDDPDKDRTLPFVVEIQSHLSDLGDDPTVMIRTSWLDAYKLLAGSVRVEIGRGSRRERV